MHIWPTLAVLSFNPVAVAHNVVESSPVYFNNQMQIVLSHRGAEDSLEIIDYQTGKTLFKHPWNAKFGAATVEGENLYITGSTDHAVVRQCLTNGYKDCGEETLLKWDATVANTSLISIGGMWYMAVETEAEKGGQFRINFFSSVDLKTWSFKGELLPGKYNAAPTLRFADGYFYVFYLESHKLTHPIGQQEYGFITKIARTRDFNSFRFATVLQPPAGIPNASDLDVTEAFGTTYLTFNLGDQLSAGSIYRATFPGTFAQWVKTLWFTPHWLNTLF